LDETDRLLLNALQTDFPLTLRPYDVIAHRLGIKSGEAIRRIIALKESGVIRQISAIFDSHALGYSSLLVAFKIDPVRLDEAAEAVNRHPGVTHNYARNHVYNLWFTMTMPPGVSLEEEIGKLASAAGAESAMTLPTIRLFKIGVAFDLTESDSELPIAKVAKTETTDVQNLTAAEIKAVRALQNDLPIEPRPFKKVAELFSMTEDLLLDRARDFIRRGLMRRFAATLRHRHAGFAANAMGVWIVPEDRAEEVGRIMAEFQAVSHCYQRPTYPEWPYSIFTMIHGHNREECEAIATDISEATGITDYRLLYSTKEYKKIRVRYFEEVDAG
jgi:siroheme decarboxylase